MSLLLETIDKIRLWAMKPADCRRDGVSPAVQKAIGVKDFADSVGAKLVMPTKGLLDKTRDCTGYFQTNVARTFEEARQQLEPVKQQKLRRAK